MGIIYFEGRDKVMADHKRAYEAFVVSEKIDPVATYYIGLIYARGLGGFREDKEEARERFSRAAAGGVGEAMRDYAEYLHNGIGGAVDLVEALKWYQKASANGQARRTGFLAGKLLEKGEGPIKPDPIAACDEYRKAAEAGHAQAARYVAQYYSDNRIGMHDPGRSYKYYLMGADAGDDVSMVAVARTKGRDGAREQFEFWCNKAIEKGNREAMNLLGEALRDGLYGVTTNRGRAVTLFKQSRERNFAIASRNLGKCCEFGWGVEKSFKEAATFYKEAGMRGDAWGYYFLGRVYRNGGPGLPKNLTSARQWYQKAADLKIAKAKQELYSMDEEQKNWGRKKPRRKSRRSLQ